MIAEVFSVFFRRGVYENVLKGDPTPHPTPLFLYKKNIQKFTSCYSDNLLLSTLFTPFFINTTCRRNLLFLKKKKFSIFKLLLFILIKNQNTSQSSVVTLQYTVKIAKIN
jgi:hypothetical protein